MKNEGDIVYIFNKGQILEKYMQGLEQGKKTIYKVCHLRQGEPAYNCSIRIKLKDIYTLDEVKKVAIKYETKVFNEKLKKIKHLT